MLLYRSTFKFFDYFFFAFIVGSIFLLCYFNGIYTLYGFLGNSTIIAIQIVLLYYYIRFHKRFELYQNRLVIKYPSFLCIADQSIEFSRIKEIKLKMFSKGTNRMIVVYEKSKIKYSFYNQFGLDLNRMIYLLKSLRVRIEVEKGWK